MTKESFPNNMQEEIEDEPEYLIPVRLRIIASVIFAILAIIVLTPLIKYAYSPTDPPPQDVGLSSIAMFCLIILLGVNLPWERLSKVFRKLGPVEFQQRLEGQKIEQAQVIGPLEQQIEELEKIVQKLSKGKDTEVSVKSLIEKESDFLSIAQNDSDAMELFAFLEARRGNYFNASRIRALESSASKPRNFYRYRSREIYRLLRKILAAGLIGTKTSKKGNTLYGVRVA